MDYIYTNKYTYIIMHIQVTSWQIPLKKEEGIEWNITFLHPETNSQQKLTMITTANSTPKQQLESEVK